MQYFHVLSHLALDVRRTWSIMEHTWLCAVFWKPTSIMSRIWCVFRTIWCFKCFGVETLCTWMWLVCSGLVFELFHRTSSGPFYVTCVYGMVKLYFWLCLWTYVYIYVYLWTYVSICLFVNLCQYMSICEPIIIVVQCVHVDVVYRLHFSIYVKLLVWLCTTY